MSIVGIDIGGTFTDLVGYQGDVVITAKTLTVPADPTVGAATALCLAGCDVTGIRELLHGSTIAINTVLERRGAVTALVTTEGFRDIYALGRGNRPDAFNLDFHRPRPLVPRDLTFELCERMNAAGEVLRPIDLGAVETLGRRLDALGIEAVAICFLHSYANPAHEIAAGDVLRRMCPHIFVTTSHEILREYREYERTSTTALNAFVGPRVSRYLERFEDFARAEKFSGQIAIMRSNGGTMSIGEARRQPVAMMESGPVAGMIGAAHLARVLGMKQAIGFDMGGTTAKTALINDGVLPIEEGYVIGNVCTGQPMQLPVVDIVEVGAGGGSIAWIDDGGGLHVGPVSAGADPGPVCYGRGGQQPTVTDADLALGRLNRNRFLGGGMRLDSTGAEAALAKLSARIGFDAITVALGIVTIADGAMSLAVRAVSVNRGVDPRDTALIAFGGAGPLHAAAIAREIAIPQVIIPKLPGNFSALGMLMAEWRQDFVRTLIGELDRLEPAVVSQAFTDLGDAGAAALKRDGLSGGAFKFAADLRYRGQEHTIPLPVAGPDDLVGAAAKTRQRFDAQHDSRYGHAAPDQSIEIVNVRLVVTVARMDDTISRWLSAPWQAEPGGAEEHRTVVFDDPARPVEARILWRPALAAGAKIAGPAVIEEANSTTFVPPGDHARVDPWGNIVISLSGLLPPGSQP
ncbi:MAG TPA: hydantoinase/oxoprolinase family protein [Xanthobacteraceae bacterium]|nr:hydantoinase/oxoprolinase family protein [Xanthobacteraceae bacterium]